MSSPIKTLIAIQGELSHIHDLGRIRIDEAPTVIKHVNRRLDEIQRLIDRALEENP